MKRLFVIAVLAAAVSGCAPAQEFGEYQTSDAGVKGGLR